MDVRVGLWRKLITEKLMLLNCGIGEDSWESLGLQGDPTSHSKDQSWVFIGRTDAKAETPVLWPPHAKSWLIGKDSDAGRDCGQEEKGMTEDEMAGWHHWLDGHESEWSPGVGDGQGGLACCNSWGRKESDTTEQLNRTEYSIVHIYHNFFIHSSVSGRLGCFLVLAIVNSASTNWGTRVFFNYGRTTILLWVTTCWDWKDPDIPT